MLLPTELLALVFLATSSTAYGAALTSKIENGQPANATTLAVEPTPAPQDPPLHDPADINLNPDDNSCETDSCGTLWIIPQLPSAPGFEDSPEPTPFVPEEKPPPVITTRTPVVVDVQTNTVPRLSPSGGSVGGGRSNEDANQNSNGNPPPPPPATGSYSVRITNPPSTPTQSPSENPLLQDIISQMMNPDAQARPQAQVLATPSEDARAPAPLEQVTPGPKVQSSGGDATASPQGLPRGGTLTAGSAVVTLTPGLSTTLSRGSDATFISITTDQAGRTIITVSSSGTAVTARVTDAPATLTLPGTGFEANITRVARPADVKTSTGGGAVTTSSKGAAELGRGGTPWQLNMALGIVGVLRAVW